MNSTNKVMDFRIILSNQNLTRTTIIQEEDFQDYTVTFIIGSCVLAIFLLLGIVASAYLCLTLKKGTFLWVTDSSRQLTRDKTEEVQADSGSIGLREIKASGSQEATAV